jgi:hypothetical protein
MVWQKLQRCQARIAAYRGLMYFFIKVVQFYLFVSIFSGCATKNDINKFISSTLIISNNIKTLGLIGENIETNNIDVAAGIITKSRIQITSVGEGSALLFVSNKSAEIAIINIIVSQTGAISINTIVKYIDQPLNTILTGTKWIFTNEGDAETIQFISGTKGIYKIIESSGVSHSLNFSYRISENEISLVFTINGIMSTTGTITENSIILLNIDDDENQIYLKFTKASNN